MNDMFYCNQCYLFLSPLLSYAHKVLQFTNALSPTLIPADLALSKTWKECMTSWTKNGPNVCNAWLSPLVHLSPWAAHSTDPLDNHSDKYDPLFWIELMVRGFEPPLDPIHLSNIPACLFKSLDNPASFVPDLSDNNPDGTVQAYLYWRHLEPTH